MWNTFAWFATSPQFEKPSSDSTVSSPGCITFRCRFS